MKPLSGVVVCSVLLLAGCGQKGPLYLPDDAPPASKPYSACDVTDAPCRQRAEQASTTSSAPTTAPATQPTTESSTATSANSTESSAP